ncbi:MAG: cation-translocating P-type ATPase [Burkholderiales bacterium]|nr:cation-translocating P-type ATPase [Burkholderiales bacterium]
MAQPRTDLSAHTLDRVALCALLQTAPAGLSRTEAARRLAAYGPNALRAAARGSPWHLFAAQFKNVLILILLGATALSALLGHGVEATAITVIVTFAVLLGFVQEYRAERALQALQQMVAPTATVLRDGEELEVPAREIVPGDVLLLAAGDRVPADARLIEAVNLQADEAALTGESTPVDKHDRVLADAGLALGDRRNMVYAGTAIGTGRARAIVTATAMATEFGQIAGMLQTVETSRTPLQLNLDRLGMQLARAALVVVIVIVGLGLARGQPFIEMLVFGIALAVAVVPEALPAVVTISLAIGVQRLARRRALMRRLQAVETLGSTTIICSDKTGTLTRDEMTARALWVGGATLDITGAGYVPQGRFEHGGAAVEPGPALRELLTAGALCSDTHVVQREDDARWQVKGDPTEAALVVAAAKAGLQKVALDAAMRRVAEIPFSSETKRMVTLHRVDDGIVAYAKGAPEVILAGCSRWRTDDGDAVLTESDAAAVVAAAEAMAGHALRVLAVARRDDATLDNAVEDMTLLGLVGLIDPPRDEAKAALAACRSAGVRVVMITGDHPVTAAAVARELGLLEAATNATDKTSGRIISGAELATLDDAALAQRVREIAVYARVSPAHKLRVVTALQAHGHVVAMTGDGVNDAPALKKADIGVAMGVTGTDVAKEAAAMTLMDDNFASIVAAVEEGRGIFCNIKKYLMFLLSSNIGEIGLMAGAALLGLPLPLTAVQILYVNLATDGLPALALAVDPPERDLMQRPPRDARRGIFTRPVVALMLIGGAWSALVNVSLFAWALQSGRAVAEAMTMTFVGLVLIQFFKAYNFRSDHVSVTQAPFANKWLNLAIVWEVGLLVLIVHLPILHAPFGTYALSAADWLIVAGTAASIVPVLELTKWCVRRGWFDAPVAASTV